jgi:hypothetical protein
MPERHRLPSVGLQNYCQSRKFQSIFCKIYSWHVGVDVLKAGGKAVGRNRYYGANDTLETTLVLGY